MLSRRAWSRLVALAGLAGTAGSAGCGDDPPTAAERRAAIQRTAPLPDPADLLIVGGTVLTLDRADPRVEALAIRDGAVQMFGKRAELERLKGPDTKVLDLQGGLAVPGLTDAHAHFTGIGAGLETIDLRGAQSVEEVVERCRKGARPDGWIIGRGWDQNLWGDQAMPTHDALSAAFPDRPVWLRRVDGHAGWGNAIVLERAGIEAETADPEGGEILRDEEGVATGVLIDAAMDLVEVPKPSDDDVRRQMLAAQAHLVERGLVGIHDMGVSEQADRIYRELLEAGKLAVRVTGYADSDWFTRDLIKTKPEPLDPASRYALVGVKLYADGALGSRGAALLAGYADRRGHRGKLQHSRKWFDRVTMEALANDWQVATHAIGDRGIRTVLDAYQVSIHRYRHKDHRWRVEHAQIINPSDIGRFAELELIASMQPTHATSDMPWVPARVGEKRLEGAYAWQRFSKAGVRLALGSDAPVERVDVTHGLHAAITREDPFGKPEGGWLPEQRLSFDQAIIGFSRDAAYAAKRDEALGTLEAGKRADVTCFAADLSKLPPKQIRDAKVLATIVDGDIVYRAED
jgi:predicted amidohydrolase YtcJ